MLRILFFHKAFHFEFKKSHLAEKKKLLSAKIVAFNKSQIFN